MEEFHGRHVMKNIHDLYIVAFCLLSHGKQERQVFGLQPRYHSRRVEEGSLKEDDALEVGLLLVGHVFEQAIPDAHIEQEFAAVAALDLLALFV